MSVFKWWTMHGQIYPIDMSLAELEYYPCIISLNKYTGSCNILSPKKNVPNKKYVKDIY